MISEKESIIFALRKELYKKSFFEFFKKSCTLIEPSTSWDFNWHILYLCGILQKETRRLINKGERETDYIINIPFRSSKSLIFSIIFPVWCWTVFPEAKIMTISYSESLAIKQAYLSKILMRTEWFKKYFPEITIMADSNAKGEYTNVFGGTRQAFGMNGSITGTGADFIIVDDPNKVNESKKQLQNANIIYDETIFNRLNDPNAGQRFIIQQRINENDLSGHLLKMQTEHELISIPAKTHKNISPTFLVEYYHDGLFWVKRFSRSILKRYKTALGTRGYNSQLMQVTSADGGNILKDGWFKIVEWDEEKHKNIKWDMFCDTAYTEKQSNDPTALMICGKWNNFLLIKKVWTGHLEFPDLINKIKDLAAKFKVRRIFVEPKASGKSVVQQLRRISKLNLVELPANKSDKETECNAISPTVEGQRVILIDGSWNKAFIEEVCIFPLSTHDDQVDVLIYAINKLLLTKSFNYAL